jgi:hypothetical protein
MREFHTYGTEGGRERKLSRSTRQQQGLARSGGLRFGTVEPRADFASKAMTE